MKVTLPVLIFVGIPEGIALATLVFVLAEEKLYWNKIFLIGSSLSIGAYLLRLLPITFGVHTIVILILLFFILNVFEKLDAITSINVSIFTFLILVLTETATIPLLMTVLNISKNKLMQDELLKIMVYFPHIILLFLIAYLIKYKKIIKFSTKK
ncbi:MAG: hypothetical protein PWP71_2172 [Clostridia bacterium]|jgi:hypothetical protein|nr:hypothetical protein [Clostridia bacterium]